MAIQQQEKCFLQVNFSKLKLLLLVTNDSKLICIQQCFVNKFQAGLFCLRNHLELKNHLKSLYFLFCYCCKWGALTCICLDVEVALKVKLKVCLRCSKDIWTRHQSASRLSLHQRIQLIPVERMVCLSHQTPLGYWENSRS